jgi:hypothetical protein
MVAFKLEKLFFFQLNFFAFPTVLPSLDNILWIEIYFYSLISLKRGIAWSRWLGPPISHSPFFQNHISRNILLHLMLSVSEIQAQSLIHTKLSL